jgi:phage terminase large subunit-like protein
VALECFGKKPVMAPGGTGAIDTMFVSDQADSAADGTSTFTFKSFEVRREKLQGESVELVWVDERPIEEVYSELLARTSATDGHLIVSYTPVGEGASAGLTYKFLSEPSSDRSVHRITSGEVRHISEARREELAANHQEHEREVRLEGNVINALRPSAMRLGPRPRRRSPARDAQGTRLGSSRRAMAGDRGPSRGVGWGKTRRRGIRMSFLAFAPVSFILTRALVVARRIALILRAVNFGENEFCADTFVTSGEGSTLPESKVARSFPRRMAERSPRSATASCMHSRATLLAISEPRPVDRLLGCVHQFAGRPLGVPLRAGVRARHSPYGACPKS